MNKMKELYDSGKGTPEFNALVERVKSGDNVSGLDLRCHYLISKSNCSLIRNNPKIVIDLSCIFVIIITMMSGVLIFLTPDWIDYRWTVNLKDSVSKPIIAYIDVMTEYVYIKMVWLSLYVLLFVFTTALIILTMIAMLMVMIAIIFVTSNTAKVIKWVFSKLPTSNKKFKLPQMKKYSKEDFE